MRVKVSCSRIKARTRLAARERGSRLLAVVVAHLCRYWRDARGGWLLFLVVSGLFRRLYGDTAVLAAGPSILLPAALEAVGMEQRFALPALVEAPYCGLRTDAWGGGCL